MLFDEDHNKVYKEYICRIVMKKSMFPKIFLLLVIGLMVFSVAAPMVSAEEDQDGVLKSLWDAIFGGIFGGGGGPGSIGDSLEEFGIEGASSTTTWKDLVSLVLMMALVFMLVYDIVSFLPFFDGAGKFSKILTFAFPAVFSILAFMFVDVRELGVIASTYGAAGIAMVAVVPFVVILAFTYKLDKLAEDNTKPTYKFLSTGVWMFFVGYLVLKLGSLKDNFPKSPVIQAYYIVIVVALVMMIFHSKIYLWLTKKGKEKVMKIGIRKGARAQIRKLRNRIEEIQTAMTLSETDTEERENLRKEKDSLEEAIVQLQRDS